MNKKNMVQDVAYCIQELLYEVNKSLDTFLLFLESSFSLQPSTSLFHIYIQERKRVFDLLWV